MYFPSVSASGGHLVRCRMVPLRIRNLRLNRASREETDWLRQTLNREGEQFGTAVHRGKNGDLFLDWGPDPIRLSRRISRAVIRNVVRARFVSLLASLA